MSRRRASSVEWTELAFGDLEEAIGFIALDDETAARRLEGELLDAAAVLSKHPRRGRVVPELGRIGFRAYREIVVAPFRLVYREHDRGIYIVAVVHGARDLESILHGRLTRR